MLATLTPSAWAREIVRGAYDLHVHVAPDVMVRRITDLDLARRSLDLGLAGFALKSHYTPTAERAAVLNQAVPGIDVLGALTLNSSVGGMNPVAVEIAARSGARIVWMPTVDAANHRASHGALPEGATPPMWMALQADLARQGVRVPTVNVLDDRGRALPETLEVLRLVARHDLVLATGHLGRDEIFAVVAEARAAGVRRMVVTHPEFPQQDLTVAQQQALLGDGVFLERCFTTPFTGKYDWERMVANIRETGPEHTIVTTDLGQPHNPAVEDGLALMADALRGKGFSEQQIHTMVVGNSRTLAAPGNPNLEALP
jgi:hypothetical protein